MKKTILTFIAFLILTTNMTNGFAKTKEKIIDQNTEINLEQSMVFQNESAVEKYEKYLSQRRNVLSNAEANMNLNTYENEDKQNIVENFNDFIYIGNEEYELLYEEVNKEITTKITKDITSNYYVLSQIDNENGTILLQINDNKYFITQVEENIVMFNETGDTINLVETIHSETFSEIAKVEENIDFTIEDGNSIMPMAVPVNEIK